MLKLYITIMHLTVHDTSHLVKGTHTSPTPKLREKF